jgi:hypothetical protein
MNKDESKTLKYQMVELSSIIINRINRLNSDWRELASIRLRNLYNEQDSFIK